MLLAVHGVVTVPNCPTTADTITGSVRHRIRSILLKTLQPLFRAVQPDTTDADQSAALYVEELECCVLSTCAGSYVKYMEIAARVAFNLDKNGLHVLSRYTVSQLCRLSNRALRAETAHAERDARVLEEVQAVTQRAADLAAAAKTVTESADVGRVTRCPSCHNADGLQQLPRQARSCDEGMDTFFKCPKCQHGWKANN